MRNKPAKAKPTSAQTPKSKIKRTAPEALPRAASQPVRPIDHLRIQPENPLPLFTFETITEEIFADTETPVSVYLKLGGMYSCLFESVEGEERLSRFSYIGTEPVAVLTASVSTVSTVDGKAAIEIRDQKFAALKFAVETAGSVRAGIERSLSAFANKPPQPATLAAPMITSGAFGYLGYDALHLTEKIPFAKKNDAAGLPDVLLMFFDTLVIFDNIKRKIFLVANYLNAKDRPNAEQKINRLRKKIFAPLKPAQVAFSREKAERVTSNTTKAAYLEKVRKAKSYIEAGDIFQVQVSQRLMRRLNAKPFDVYRALRTINPSPYLYYLDLGKVKIIGSSPELLVRLDAGSQGKRIVQTRPIAGTAKRGLTPEEDEVNARLLLADEKERAEHLMLIDLGRNDIGRVAKTGTVETTEMMVIEKYSHVMHIVSNVKGVLKENLSAMEAFWSCFPAGTLTGAPKIRAMEIIYELETEKRGLYGGAVGYFDFNGNLNTAIAIRTMVAAEGKIYFQAAGGIVADSVPEREFEETMNKMRAGLRAVESLIHK
ncbi:MAG: anthranilate synthase component I [Rhizobacter sp.]|nr:anthranilate synthase component I [Chlorobiales bacterium]